MDFSQRALQMLLRGFFEILRQVLFPRLVKEKLKTHPVILTNIHSRVLTGIP